MRENRKSGSEGGEAQTNELSLPLSLWRPVDSPMKARDVGGSVPSELLHKESQVTARRQLVRCGGQESAI